MNQRKRIQNEKEFQNWQDYNDGKRLYWKDVMAADKSGKLSRYEKLVDSDEKTISFVQKIIDKNGTVIEVHEKFPIDKGHIVLVILVLFISILIYSY